MAVIEGIAFDDNASEEIKKLQYGRDWPVVYVINNDKEAYIGETVNATMRISQHLNNPKRRALKCINVISDSNFNKSVVLDLESYLIKYMSSDGLFELQNSNRGIVLHNYYEREEYEKSFGEIWEQLKELNIVNQSLTVIQNSDLFKYSPYKALNLDQYKVVEELMNTLVDTKNDVEGCSIIVNGSAGTGKTVLATYLMKLLTEVGNVADFIDTESDPGLLYISETLEKLDEMKVGLVIPQQSLRKTIKKVFKNIKGLNGKMVLSPNDASKETYDLLIVDEAHRLKQRKALSQYPIFDNNNRKFGLGNDGTELDWILKSSKNQIFFYDSSQSVKPSDVDKERFDAMFSAEKVKQFELRSQWRCDGGNDYIEYVKCIMSDKPPVDFKQINNYDFCLFDDVNEMVEAIKDKDKDYGLCRIVAGYSWKWKTKNKIADGECDIEIGDYKYIWNSEHVDWVNSKNSLNEIGCIHTVQGYDLNYTGVILGNEIKYDIEKGGIYIDKSNYHDLQGKTSLKTESSLKNYILNIYVTLMTRGIKGTYVYACDEGMQEYLSKFIKAENTL
ncbi:MAG: DNA/RNA helicase domain-containing protein [Anaerovoracaceae bacterium]